MNAIILNTEITENGIFISSDILKTFKNKNVKIIIEQSDKNEEKNSLLKFAGSINNDEAEDLLKSIEECRTIDLESWK
jgi:hypothetical protein